MCSAKNNPKAHFLYIMGNELSANKISDVLESLTQKSLDGLILRLTNNPYS